MDAVLAATRPDVVTTDENVLLPLTLTIVVTTLAILLLTDADAVVDVRSDPDDVAEPVADVVPDDVVPSDVVPPLVGFD